MFNKRCTLLFLFVAITLVTSVCAFAQENIGFEKGAFENWQCAMGTVDADGVVHVEDSAPIRYYFTLFKNNGGGPNNVLDGIGRFSVFSPNGSKYSVLMGNDYPGNIAQRMSYKLKVPETGANTIVFNYALVLDNPHHEENEQARFTVKVFNVTDNQYVKCPSFDFIEASNIPGFKPYSRNKDIKYKDWSSASIDLSNLNGKEIRLEFTVSHCTDGAHFGYAYFDIEENFRTLVEGDNYCPGQTYALLSAPPGYRIYRWYKPDLKTLLSEKQYFSVSPSNAALSTVALVLIPYIGQGCADTVFVTPTPLNTGFKTVAKDSIIACPGPGAYADLTKPEITAGSSPNLRFEYFSSSLAPLPAPYKIIASGLYYIRATNAGGCSNLMPVKIVFRLPALNIKNPPEVAYPTTINLADTYVPERGVTYSYYADKDATIPLINFSALTKSSTYYIKAESPEGCINLQPVKVMVQPPPPFNVTGPKGFTPNSDGINDNFLLSLEGFVEFNRLKIYSRNGTLVFSTTNKTQAWDGTINGRQATAGTYYWVFEGYDIYNQKKVAESSYITLLR